ncbi:hypothetical protein BGZ46_006285, partial [Entomortierella lignicola]
MDSALRAHRIKKLHGTLPTLQQMRQRYPGLYDTDKCQRCASGDVETDHHLWNCDETLEDQKKEWESVVGRVTTFGKRAWRHAVRKWRKDREEAMKAGRELGGRCPTFTERDERDIWPSLAWIGGVAERHQWHMDIREETDESQEGWTVKNL